MPVRFRYIVSLTLLFTFSVMLHGQTSRWLACHGEWKGNINVVTLAQPTLRQHCKRWAVDDTGIDCIDANHVRSRFQKEDIATVIEGPTHGHFWGNAPGFLIIGGLLAGSFFVPTAASVVMRVLVVPILQIMAFGDNEPPDHWRDRILYQRANISHQEIPG